MSLGDDVKLATPDLRSAAESMMRDRADIIRDGAPVFDATTGTTTATVAEVYTDRPCWLRMPTAQETSRAFGSEQVDTIRLIACFPFDTVGVVPGDIVRFTEAADPDIVARTFRVVAVPLRTDNIMKAFPVEARA